MTISGKTDDKCTLNVSIYCLHNKFARAEFVRSIRQINKRQFCMRSEDHCWLLNKSYTISEMKGEGGEYVVKPIIVRGKIERTGNPYIRVYRHKQVQGKKDNIYNPNFCRGIFFT